VSWLKYLPQGYCPPSLGKHRIRHLPKGSYGGNMVGGQPDGFGSSSWYVPPNLPNNCWPEAAGAEERFRSPQRWRSLPEVQEQFFVICSNFKSIYIYEELQVIHACKVLTVASSELQLAYMVDPGIPRGEGMHQRCSGRGFLEGCSWKRFARAFGGVKSLESQQRS